MPTRDISTRLVLAGEKEYRDKIAQINAEYRTLESALKLVDSQFKDQQNTLQALEAKNKALNDSISKQTEKYKAEQNALEKSKSLQTEYANIINDAKNRLEALVKSTDEASKETDEYKQNVAEIQAEINRYEKAEGEAALAVEKHSAAANRAGAKLNNLNGELVKNEQYLDEAKKSADGCAVSIDKYGKETKEASEESKEFGEKSKVAIDTLAAALASAGVAGTIKEIADTLMECINGSIEFESAMAGVAKTTDMTKEELDAMGEEIKDLGLEIPITTKELAKIAEVAGQLGVEKDNLLSFSVVMANLGVATNMTSEEAATMLAQFTAITGMDASLYSNLGSAIVALGNNFATNEKKITEFSQTVAGAGVNAGISEPNVLALGAAVTSLGIEAGTGGTNMSKLIGEMQMAVETGEGLTAWADAAGMSAARFAALWGSDATAALTAFIGNLNHTNKSATVTLANLGIGEERMNRMITSLANAEDKSRMLSKALDLSNTAWKENTALTEEAATRYETTESKITMLKNSANNLKIAVGDLLTPALRNLTETGIKTTEWATGVVDNNKALVPLIAALTAALGVLTVAFAGFSILKIVTPLIQAFNAALALNPAIAVATAIAAVVAAIIVLANTTEEYVGETEQALLDLTESIDKTKKAYDDVVAGITGEEKNISNLISTLDMLSSKEVKSEADKRIILETIKQLNEAIPDLGLSYDNLSGKISMTSDDLKKLAKAQVLEERAAADVKRLTELYGERRDLTNQLGEAQARYARALADKEQFEAATGRTMDITNAEENLKEVTEALTPAIAANAAEIKKVEEGLEEYTIQTDAATGVTTEYGAKFAETAATIKSEIAQLKIEWQESYDVAYDNISKTIGLFEKMDNSASVSVTSMIASLDSQIKFMDSYATNIEAAIKLGVDKGLVAKLMDGSAESAAILAGIVKDGGKNVAELNDKLALVEEGKDKFSSTVADMGTEFNKKMSEMEERLNRAIKEMNKADGAAAAGRAVAMAYADGMLKEMPSVRAAAKQLSDAANRGGAPGRAAMPYKNGLEYVPYDDFPAMLHKGERVLTEMEARAYAAEQRVNYDQSRTINNSKVSNVNNITVKVQGDTNVERLADVVAERIAFKLSRREAAFR